MTEPEKWKLLMTTLDEAEVYLLQSRLEVEGISCRVEAESRYPDRPDTGQSREFSAFVPLGDFEASQQILEEDEAEEDL